MQGPLQILGQSGEYHLIDLNADRVGRLRELVGAREDVFLYEGNCNEVLLRRVFPRLRYEDYRRALVLLDPYGLHLAWELMQAAALGTPDAAQLPTQPGAQDCNYNNVLPGPDLTGARANCVSDVGAFDMVGNVEEMVAEWQTGAAVCLGPMFDSGIDCTGGASLVDSPAAISRGGGYGGSEAGVFSVRWERNPTDSGAPDLGFRAAR